MLVGIIGSDNLLLDLTVGRWTRSGTAGSDRRSLDLWIEDQSIQDHRIRSGIFESDKRSFDPFGDR